MRAAHALTALLLAPPAIAQEVDLELVLLADASGSISNDEIALQREVYAQAITSPEALAAIGNPRPPRLRWPMSNGRPTSRWSRTG